MGNVFRKKKSKESPAPILTVKALADAKEEEIKTIDEALKKNEEEKTNMRRWSARNSCERKSKRLSKRRKSCKAELGNLRQLERALERVNSKTQKIRETEDKINTLNMGKKKERKEMIKMKDIHKDLKQYEKVSEAICSHNVPDIGDDKLDAELATYLDETAPNVPSTEPVAASIRSKEQHISTIPHNGNDKKTNYTL